MIQIRHGVFETNSSSTHSVCITKRRDAELDIPESLHFAAGRFEWEYRTLTTPEEKASYLFSSIMSIYDKAKAGEMITSIMDTLEDVGCHCTFDEPVYEYGYCSNADVDHAGADDHPRFVELTVSNKGRLLRYLFSPQSFVITGNDNAEHNVGIHVDYQHETYYKGN